MLNWSKNLKIENFIESQSQDEKKSSIGDFRKQNENLEI